MKRRIGLGAAMALGGGCQHQFGAAHLARPWAPAPSRPAVQAVRSDPDFVGKLRDIVGLYVDPPAHAVVLSVDEKSQIQALDRTQPGLPMKRGRAGTMTHDDKRNGTTTLFAAMNGLDGTVIGRKIIEQTKDDRFIVPDVRPTTASTRTAEAAIG
jgi:hypothetical protein